MTSPCLAPNLDLAGPSETPHLKTRLASLVQRTPPAELIKRQLPVAKFSAFLACALLGAALGYTGEHLARPYFLGFHHQPWPVILSLIAPLFLWFVAVGWHELGHVIGGWLGGGNFLLWVAGPFMVRRTPAGLRLAWNRSVNLTGGMAVCTPLDPAQVSARRMAGMTAGGPLASLLLAFAAIWLAGAWDFSLSPLRILGQNVLMELGLISALLYLVTAWPGTAGGFKTDGKRMLDLLRAGAPSDQESALLVLTSASLAGIRPSAYDPALVTRAIALKDGSLFDTYGHLMVYHHAADRGHWAAAQACLDHAVAGAARLPVMMRDIVLCEYAWLLAAHTAEVAAARTWLDAAGKLDFDPATRLRAEAAVLLAENQLPAAAAAARQGLQALRERSLSPVESPFAREALEHLLTRATSPTTHPLNPAG